MWCDSDKLQSMFASCCCCCCCFFYDKCRPQKNMGNQTPKSICCLLKIVPSHSWHIISIVPSKYIKKYFVKHESSKTVVSKHFLLRISEGGGGLGLGVDRRNGRHIINSVPALPLWKMDIHQFVWCVRLNMVSVHSQFSQAIFVLNIYIYMCVDMMSTLALSHIMQKQKLHKRRQAATVVVSNVSQQSHTSFDPPPLAPAQTNLPPPPDWTNVKSVLWPCQPHIVLYYTENHNNITYLSKPYEHMYLEPSANRIPKDQTTMVHGPYIQASKDAKSLFLSPFTFLLLLCVTFSMLLYHRPPPIHRSVIFVQSPKKKLAGTSWKGDARCLGICRAASVLLYVCVQTIVLETLK